ncbi:MAG: heterodisulfide reductase-related iron-sulfur binding cluster [Firmicutes bacterium]|nr:heterodisulfide reductase-related iron-sulfur binding cluster [Bacillota bacterium]
MPGREVYWNINGHYLLYLLLIPTLLIFFLGVWQRWRSWQIGKPENRKDNPLIRLQGVLKYALLQARIFKNSYPAIFHAGILWGFGLLFAATLMVMVEADFGIPILRGKFYLFLSLMADLAGLVVVVGCVMALVRRIILKPDFLESQPSDVYIVLLIAAIIITGFVVEGLRIIATNDPWAAWSPIGAFVAALLKVIDAAASDQTWRFWHVLFWWGHLLLAYSFIAYLPWSKLLHIFTGPVNVYYRSLEPKGTLRPVNFEEKGALGAAKLIDFTWKDLLDLDACTQCGRCKDRCPAYRTARILSPQNVIKSLKEALHQRAKGSQWTWNFKKKEATATKATANEAEVTGNVVSTDAIWSCTTCRACMEECPVFIEHGPKIIEMRRYLAMEVAEVPETIAVAMKSLEQRGHPFRGTPFSRNNWYEGLEIREMADVKEAKVLYWAGCAAALDERNQMVARAFVQLLQKASADFAILGKGEKCCGDLARRTGNEYLFAMMAAENRETLQKYKFNILVTSCPHCYNSFKSDYLSLRGRFRVMHHTEYLNALMQEGRLKLNCSYDSEVKITFHDPCYLGRYNDVYEPPRSLISASSSIHFVEMKASRDRSFCCGGGGGRFWMHEEGPRISHVRMNQVLETGANLLATACPFCLSMLSI